MFYATLVAALENDERARDVEGFVKKLDQLLVRLPFRCGCMQSDDEAALVELADEPCCFCIRFNSNGDDHILIFSIVSTVSQAAMDPNPCLLI